MRYLMLFAAGAMLAAPSARAQGLTARELFYRDDTAAKPPEKPKAPTRRTTAKAKPAKRAPIQVAAGTPTVTPPANDPPEIRPAIETPSITTPDGSEVVKASATNFGVRYNVVQVTDRERKTRQPVEPETAFHAGDCVAIDMMSNRDGFLYVFNKGTSGAWQVLLPSAGMPDQSNRIRRGQTHIVPGDYCFEFDSTAGTEKLLVVLTEREEDARTLGDAIRERGPNNDAPPPTMLALNRSIEKLRDGQLIGRDIKIAKIGAPQAQGEPAHSVYAVRASTGPNERLVLEIDLRHE